MIDHITKEVYRQAQNLYMEFKQLIQERNIKDIDTLENECRHISGYITEDTANDNDRKVLSYTDSKEPDTLEYIEMYVDGNDLSLSKCITIYLLKNEIMFEVTDITEPFENAEILIDDNYAY